MSGSNRLAGLTARPKDIDAAEVRKIRGFVDRMKWEPSPRTYQLHPKVRSGFVDRTPRKKPGRKPSPRTYQLHPKVFPRVGGGDSRRV